jgi:hypothetical protein
VTPKGHDEELQAAIRAQIGYLTNQLAKACLYDRRRCRTPPLQEEDEDEDDDGYGFANPFEERWTLGRWPLTQAHANQWESGFKLDIPEFSGCMQLKEFLDLVAAVEEILDFKGVPEDRQVFLVATKFWGRAAAWWQKLKQARVRKGKLKIISWEKLLRKMQPAFLPHNYLWTMYQRLQNWSQCLKSVDEYTELFYKLLAWVDLSESDEQLVSRYIGVCGHKSKTHWTSLTSIMFRRPTKGLY